MTLLGPVQVRELCEQLGIRPTKTLGQNFVIDPGTVRKVVREAGVRPDGHVLEIGPGLGSLTLAILESGAALSCVEIDPVLAGALTRTVIKNQGQAAAQRLRLLRGDALQIAGPQDLLLSNAPQVLHCGSDERLSSPPELLVANLPYNVSVPLILGTLQALPSVRGILVMVQEEVADRLAATPGSRTYGVPSVKLAWYGSARKVAKIGTNVFYPAPNVGSALLYLDRASLPTLPPDLAEVFAGPQAIEALRQATFAAIDAAFGQRRKTLRQSLERWAGSKAAAEAACQAAGVDPGARAEQLGIMDFARIAWAGGVDPRESHARV